jgi:hypothetical protein
MAVTTTTPLQLAVTHFFDGIEIAERGVERLLDFASWRRTPEFVRRGRVARGVLEAPACLTADPSYRLRAAKLKGVGVYDPASLGRYRDRILDSFSDNPLPPTTIPLHSFTSYPHVGFTAQGQYTVAYGAVAPVGGIVHERAVREYNNARVLLARGVPSIVPLVVVRYEDLAFEEQPMGAVITLSPEPASYRLSEVQYLAAVQRGQDGPGDAYYDRVCRSLGLKGDPATEVIRLQAVNLLAKRIGRLIHDFSAAGLYRYSPEWSNFEYSFDRDEVFLTDLDSVLSLYSLPEELRALQVLRDLGALIYRLVSKFGTPSALHQYSLGNLLAFDPIRETLAGYFPATDIDQLDVASKRLWNAFVPHLFLLKKHQREVKSEWSSERRRSYKMDHDLFYVLTITSLFPFYRDSDLASAYPSDLTVDELLSKAEKYLGDRYEYFLYLLHAHGSWL